MPARITGIGIRDPWTGTPSEAKPTIPSLQSSLVDVRRARQESPAQPLRRKDIDDSCASIGD
jgi:hypothetical protein